MGDKIKVVLIFKEWPQVSPVITLEGRVGIYIDCEGEALTHSHLLPEALLGGQVYVSALWKSTQKIWG